MDAGNSSLRVVIDIHSSRITLEELQVELRLHPSREKYWGTTPLILAARFGNIAVVEFLLSIGANIHANSKV